MASLSSLLCLFVVAGTAIMTAKSHAVPTKWFSVGNHLKYKVILEATDWNTAKASCERIGGTLAYRGMKDYGFRVAIANIMLPRGSFWIGMSDQHYEGQWKWVDYNPVLDTESHWRNGEPNNVHGNEDCGEIRFDDDFRTNDVDCGVPHPALCEAFDFVHRK